MKNLLPVYSAFYKLHTKYGGIRIVDINQSEFDALTANPPKDLIMIGGFVLSKNKKTNINSTIYVGRIWPDV